MVDKNSKLKTMVSKACPTCGKGGASSKAGYSGKGGPTEDSGKATVQPSSYLTNQGEEVTGSPENGSEGPGGSEFAQGIAHGVMAGMHINKLYGNLSGMMGEGKGGPSKKPRNLGKALKRVPQMQQKDRQPMSRIGGQAGNSVPVNGPASGMLSGPTNGNMNPQSQNDFTGMAMQPQDVGQNPQASLGTRLAGQATQVPMPGQGLGMQGSSSSIGNPQEQALGFGAIQPNQMNAGLVKPAFMSPIQPQMQGQTALPQEDFNQRLTPELIQRFLNRQPRNQLSPMGDSGRF